MTPPILRAFLREVTGLNVEGLVEEIESLGEKSYRMMYADGFVHLLRQDKGWLITRFGRDGKVLDGWSTIPDDKTKIGEEVLREFIKPSRGRLEVEYLSSYVSDTVCRRRYQTNVGEVLIHSRLHARGTELILEKPGPDLLHLIWDRKLGGFAPQDVRPIDKLLF
jgi:hypothetical protein